MVAPVDWLRRSAEITQALRRGRRSRQQVLRVAARPSGLPRSRLALSVSRRVGSAVVRNRVKRRLRALFRSGAFRSGALREGYDIVVTAHAEAGSATFDEIRRDLERCLAHLNLLVAEEA